MVGFFGKSLFAAIASGTSELFMETTKFVKLFFSKNLDQFNADSTNASGLGRPYFSSKFRSSEPELIQAGAQFSLFSRLLKFQPRALFPNISRIYTNFISAKFNRLKRQAIIKMNIRDKRNMNFAFNLT